MWRVKTEEMCMQFLVYPGFTEEQIGDKILSDEVIFMDEAVYHFVMFAIHHNFRGAISEVSEGLEFEPSYIFECELAAISEDGNVVLLFKPMEEETIEITEEFKSKVFPELMRSIGLEPRKEKEETEKEETEKIEEDSEEESSSDDIEWL